MKNLFIVYLLSYMGFMKVGVPNKNMFEDKSFWNILFLKIFVLFSVFMIRSTQFICYILIILLKNSVMVSQLKHDALMNIIKDENI